MDLVLRYDPRADILTLMLREGAITDEKLLDSDVLLGLDENGELGSLEVWDASKRSLLKSLADLAREKRDIGRDPPRKRVQSAGVIPRAHEKSPCICVHTSTRADQHQIVFIKTGIPCLMILTWT